MENFKSIIVQAREPNEATLKYIISSASPAHPDIGKY